MRKNLISSTLSVAVVAGLEAPALAGGSPGSIGVGAEFMNLGIGGASVNFDQGDFHAGGFLGFADSNASIFDATTIDIGGRFYYHIHSTAMSDFSVGGALGIRHIDLESPAEDVTDLYIDLGAQIRVFVVSNVALSATVGLGLITGDSDGVVLDGNVIGGAGIHYYFF